MKAKMKRKPKLSAGQRKKRLRAFQKTYVDIIERTLKGSAFEWDAETNLIDLLADLRHYAAQAHRHYLAELEEHFNS